MNNKLLFTALLCLIVIIGAVSNLKEQNPPSSIESADQTNQESGAPTRVEINYLASFAIYTKGVKRSFSAPMYHNLS